MSHYSIALLTSHDELGPVYTVRYRAYYSNVPVSVDFFDRGRAVEFSKKIIDLFFTNCNCHSCY